MQNIQWFYPKEQLPEEGQIIYVDVNSLYGTQRAKFIKGKFYPTNSARKIEFYHVKRWATILKGVQNVCNSIE